jgi:glutamate racemase
MFDSGVGGLSVARAVRRRVPWADVHYLSDSAWFPYGAKEPAALAERTEAITRFLLAQGARIVVVACNSASGAAIRHLRARFELPFVGVEPAVKVAADSGKARVGVLCTAVTAQAARYQQLVERGEAKGPGARAVVARELAPLLDARVEAVVLGCTHYAFLAELVEELAGVPVLEPSDAVARQAERVYLAELARRSETPERSREGSLRVFTTGDVLALSAFLREYALDSSEPRQIELPLLEFA